MFSSNPRFSLPKCDCHRTKDDLPVQDGLALTPAMIAELTAQGVPISEPQAMQFFDGYKRGDFNPGIINRRGVDIADVWNAEKDARTGLRRVFSDTLKRDELNKSE